MLGVWSAEESSALAAWLTFGVLLISAILVLLQVREAVRLREAQTRPFVVVDFDTEGVLLNLIIENTGSLVARDVRLEFEPTFKSTQFDPWPPEKSSLLTQGIPSIPPSKRLRFLLDSIPVRVEKDLPLTYTVRVSYRSDERRKPFNDEYTLDLSFLLGLPEIRRKSIHDLAESLEAIQKTMKQWTEEANGIRVYAEDFETHRRESALAMAWQGVASRMRGGDSAEIRDSLRDALKSIGETGEPPQGWVDAIVEGTPVFIRLDDLKGAAREDD